MEDSQEQNKIDIVNRWRKIVEALLVVPLPFLYCMVVSYIASWYDGLARKKIGYSGSDPTRDIDIYTGFAVAAIVGIVGYILVCRYFAKRRKWVMWGLIAGVVVPALFLGFFAMLGPM
jgi:hypothetical protein